MSEPDARSKASLAETASARRFRALVQRGGGGLGTSWRQRLMPLPAALLVASCLEPGGLAGLDLVYHRQSVCVAAAFERCR